MTIGPSGLDGDPRVATAKTRLTHWTIPELRHIQVEGLVAGGWIRFEYDRDGYMEIHSNSDNVQYIEEKTGKPCPPWWEINAAWALAYELIPKSDQHVSKTQPIGTELTIERWLSRIQRPGNVTAEMFGGVMEVGRCVVVGHQGEYTYVRFEDGDERSVPMPSFKERP
jgi:hypothetical protein